MLFNSIQFLIFFPIVVMLYFLISHKYRWILLLIVSYYFYMSWNPKYLILILTSTVITYISGLSIGKTVNPIRKKFYLILCLFSNLLILFVFKYYNFSVGILMQLFGFFNLEQKIPYLDFLLPVGISFYTFQALSYVLDVYRGVIKPEKHFGIYALFVSFFPQLVAGPIERSENLLPQFKKSFNFDYNRITDGLKLMAWGFFKKVVVADRLAVIVNNVYNDVHNFSGLNLIIATIFFGIQIYCDFSAYSDIAIGAAQIMGYDLMDNFKRPYYSKTVAEFWRRWHISLSTWFKDYVYISLGGNRVSKYRIFVNLFIVFIISGLWHGASWNFIIWGALHGSYIVMGQLTQPFRLIIHNKWGFEKYSKIHKYLRIFIVYFLVNFAWIFFRANSFQDAIYVVTNLFTGWDELSTFSDIKGIIKQLGVTEIRLLYCFISITILEGFHLIQRHGSIRHMLKRKPTIFRWTIYISLILVIIFYGEFGASNFLYFQF